jgi:hypothetical protein
VWALGAVRDASGFLVVCRFCEYQRPVVLPRQAGPPAIEMVSDTTSG